MKVMSLYCGTLGKKQNDKYVEVKMTLDNHYYSGMFHFRFFHDPCICMSRH